MKNRFTGRLGGLFNVVTHEVAVCNARRSQPLKNTTRFPNPAGRHSFGNDARKVRLGGFTLIELLVVVLIIGILSAVALPQYRTAVIRARYAQLLVAADALADAEERYYLANGEYTSSRENLDVQMPPSTNYILSIDVRADGHAAINAILSDGRLSYVRYFNHSTMLKSDRQCRVFRSENYLHQICKGLTGNNAIYDSSGGYASYRFL